jgi:hypothetical protein
MQKAKLISVLILVLSAVVAIVLNSQKTANGNTYESLIDRAEKAREAKLAKSILRKEESTPQNQENEKSESKDIA